MIKVVNISKSFDRPLFEKVNLVISDSERVGLVGANGCGKSTLLKIISGNEKADIGNIQFEEGQKLGYLAQNLEISEIITVGDFLYSRFSELLNMKEEMTSLEDKMAEKSDDTDILERYGQLSSVFESMGGYDIDTKVSRIMDGLDLKIDLKQKASSLSGGQKTRLMLARVLLDGPDILLLDEPTNHLDISSIEWLEKFLLEEVKSALIVSHDRRFLDKVATKVVEIDTESMSLIEYGGNYSDYRAEKERLKERRLQEYKNQQKKFKELERDIARTKGQALKTETETIDSKMRRYSEKVARKAKAREHRLMREMNSEDAIQKPEDRKKVKVIFSSTLKQGQTVIDLKDISKSFTNLEVLKDVNLKVRSGERISIIGPNGSGKTTIFRLIMKEIEPDKGKVDVGASVKVGYLSQDYDLPEDERVIDYFRSRVPVMEGEARAYLGCFAFHQESLLRPIGKLSRGEMAKLIISILDADGCDVMLLDEPTNHLDIESMEVVEDALKAYKGAIVVISHDRYFLEKIGIQRSLNLDKHTLTET